MNELEYNRCVAAARVVLRRTNIPLGDVFHPVQMLVLAQVTDSMDEVFHNGVMSDLLSMSYVLGEEMRSPNGLLVVPFSNTVEYVSMLTRNALDNASMLIWQQTHHFRGSANFEPPLLLVRNWLSWSRADESARRDAKLFSVNNFDSDERCGWGDPIGRLSPMTTLFVIVITDGRCYDIERTGQAIRSMMGYRAFFCIVGVGNRAHQNIHCLQDVSDTRVGNLTVFNYPETVRDIRLSVYYKMVEKIPQWHAGRLTVSA